MDTKIVEKWHPKLIGKNYKIIPSKTELYEYNCVAYVLGIYTEWYGPSTKTWPYNNLPRNSSYQHQTSCYPQQSFQYYAFLR